MTMTTRAGVLCAAALGLLFTSRDASAQLDQLLYVKRTKPNILIAVDTANRMQRDVDNEYRDANIYTRTWLPWEATLGLTDGNSVMSYRRKYVGLVHTDPNANAGDKFAADHIEAVGDRDPAYSTFDERTRIAIARRALAEAVTRNAAVARFGLLRTRQDTPRYEMPATPGLAQRFAINEGPIKTTSTALAWAAQSTSGDHSPGKWRITRPVVNSVNGSVALSGLQVAADNAGANNSGVLQLLNRPISDPLALIPAGRDGQNSLDAPVDLLLTDARSEAVRLINTDTECRTTVVVLVVGGGQGNTSNGNVSTIASQFVNVSAGRRVPVHVIGVSPAAGMSQADAAEVQAQLASIATNSGGKYTEITAGMINATTPGQPVPEFVRAVNAAIQHGFTSQSDCNAGLPTEHQVTSPIIGSVNLENATDIIGNPLPLTAITHPVTGAAIPQRSNVMVTSGFVLPGFDARLRGFRVFKPQADSTRPAGYKFVADGTRLWVGCAPGTSANAPCASFSTAQRNIYTALPDGTVIPFSAANAAVLQPYLRSADAASAAALIEFIRSQPLGAVIGSTPAIMDAPSLDPPPDSDYPAFADANKNRRSIVWVGANDGMLHALDARLGVEVWAFVPFNLLPKLQTLRSGQPVGDFRYFVDSSPKVADVKIDGKWRSYLVIGQGAGGTFYQTFDATMDEMANTIGPTSDNVGQLLSYFTGAGIIPLKWTFPRYEHFDVNIGAWGDIAASAPQVAKTVGETWSDPAVGQIEHAGGRFVVLTGSGFLKHSIQQQANRGGVVAGTTFYVLDAITGAVLDSRSVGSDGLGETVDDCAVANNCTRLKNALHADPVATGPPDSRFITKAYIGDLDGKIWRFDMGLDASGVPKINQLVSLYTVNTGSGSAAHHPIFSSMAAVNVGNTQQYLFVGTGSDLLPHNGVNYSYALLVILDQGSSGTKTAQILLQKTDNIGVDEKVTSFPAVAGDIVFFSTTNYRPSAPCLLPDANLYAFTFIGGPAYDTNNDGVFNSQDSTKVRTTAGVRASAPFIVDQHLVFAAGDTIEMFGDPEDFNNGVGQAGVRILSWREVR